MNSLAYRYGQALFDVGLKENKLDRFVHEVQSLQDVFKDPVVRRFFAACDVKVDSKRSLVADLLTSSCPELVNLLLLLIENGRFNLLDEVLEAFLDLVDQFKSVKRAKVESGQTLSGEDAKRLKEALEKAYGAHFVLDFALDPSLLAGVRVRVDDRVYDYSLSNKLNQLKNVLKKEAYVD